MKQIINKNVGYVKSVGDQVIIATGLTSAFIGEVVFFSEVNSSVTGQVNSIEKDGTLKIVLLSGTQSQISVDTIIYRSFVLPSVPTGFGVLGKIISPIGHFFNKEDFDPVNFLRSNIITTFLTEIESDAPGIIERLPIKTPMNTGIHVVDTLLPLGCGQRELIIGDKNTGKTTLGVTSILNQRFFNNDKHAIWRSVEDQIPSLGRHSSFLPCVYVAIGQRRSEMHRIRNLFKKLNSLYFTSFVFTTADDNPALQFVAPYSGTTIGEWFRNNGYHSLVVYDDLTNHAAAYRQMSLLLRRPPGREAYPGDIFYVHSRLLERSAQLDKKLGGGSLTSLPIVETRGNDISAFIPTNVISITDGQIYLSSDLASQGIRPSIDVGLSVSRVGGSAQTPIMRQLSNQIKHQYTLYTNYRGVEKLGGMSDPLILSYIKRGHRMNAYFAQGLYESSSLYHQVVSLYHISNGYTDVIKEQLLNTYFKFLFNTNLFSSYISSKDDLVLYIENKYALYAYFLSHKAPFLLDVLKRWADLYQPFFIKNIESKIKSKGSQSALNASTK